MLGKGKIGQMVVPDRIVKDEGLVAVTPGIARSLVLLKYDGRHANPTEAGAERNAALAAADDDAIGLPGITERGLLSGPARKPGFAVPDRAMDDAMLAGGAIALFESFEFGHRRQN